MSDEINNPPLPKLDSFEASPFRVWRNVAATVLWIVSAETARSITLPEDSYRFRCDLPALVKKVGTSPGVLDLRVDSTLLRGLLPRFSGQSAPRHLVDLSDAVISELSAAIMSLSPTTSRQNYTLSYMVFTLCSRLVEALTAEGADCPRSFADWQTDVLGQTLEDATEEGVTVTEVATLCRLSVCQFSRLFRATYGVPLHRYLINQRIAQAKSRLSATTDPISQIALECGFSDQSSFTRRFTAVVGLSPALWRKQRGHVTGNLVSHRGNAVTTC